MQVKLRFLVGRFIPRIPGLGLLKYRKFYVPWRVCLCRLLSNTNVSALPTHLERVLGNSNSHFPKGGAFRLHFI